MSISLPTTLPATLELGSDWHLVIEQARHERHRIKTGGLTINVPWDCCLYSGEFLECFSCGFDAADALLGLASELFECDAILPPVVARNLRDLAHEAVDAIYSKATLGDIESAVFAEPVETPEQPYNYHCGCRVCGKRLVSDAETAELVCPVCPARGEDGNR